MNLEYKHLLDDTFHSDSRVWIYQAGRLFSLSEALEIEELLNQFAAQWKSHGIPVKGAAYLFFGQFIVLIADETATGVSGCSTDSSVRLVKDIEQRFGVNMFDRTTLAFIVKDKVQLLPLAQLQYAIDNGFINPDTLYFNNLVQAKEELETKWIIPAKDSWLAKKVSFANLYSKLVSCSNNGLLQTRPLEGKDEKATLFNDKPLGGSLTMTSVKIDKA